MKTLPLGVRLEPLVWNVAVFPCLVDNSRYSRLRVRNLHVIMFTNIPLFLNGIYLESEQLFIVESHVL